jgi:hypothetical protein
MSLLNRNNATSGGHRELDLTKLNKLAMELEEISDDEAVALDAVRGLADDTGTETSHYLAALALCTDIRVIAQTGPTAAMARVCVGNCQRAGAIALIDQLLASKEFDVCAINCIKQCERGPAVELVTAAGTLVIAPATAATVSDAVRQLRE